MTHSFAALGKFRTLNQLIYNYNSMGKTEFLLTLALTIVLTSLIVMGAIWIKKNKEKHPELYQNRGFVGSIIYLILNLGDLR